MTIDISSTLRHRLFIVMRFLLCMVIVICCVGLSSVHAQTSQVSSSQGVEPTVNSCGDPNVPNYSATYTAPVGEYDIYARFGKSGQNAQVSLYAQRNGTTGVCDIIGAGRVTGDSWLRIGLWHSSDANLGVTFIFQSAILGSLPDANRPTIMLVNHDHPVCQPTDFCHVTVDNAIGIVQAPGTLLSEDTLHVVRPLDPVSDKLVRVDYYIDNSLAYDTPSLRPFDQRFVPGGDHQLSRVLIYASGQQIVLEQSISRSFADGFYTFVYTLFYGNKTGVQVGAVLVVVLLLASIILAILRMRHRRHVWKIGHGLEHAAAKNKRTEVSEKFLRLSKVCALVCSASAGAVVLVIVLNTYLLQLYTVDGPSMQSTLHTGDHLVVNKLGKTWATLNHREFIPKRGEVVIFKKEQSNSVVVTQPTEYVVKRVIGLPGERVSVIHGTITVYNSDHPDGFQPDKTGSWHTTMHKDTTDNIDIVVPKGQVFVSGDNRPESVDSRYNGTIDTRDIIGDAVLRIPFTIL